MELADSDKKMTEKDLSKFENALKLELPTEYKEFYNKYFLFV